mmetsp:Transcript_26807/g.64302  ORF Transcript_26807/g.64302 Transcript_26807/m.64302 type:complete len:267 (-) Transcript_26807:43-843(-)
MSRSKNISVLEVRVISSCCTAGFIRDADARIDFVVSVANARIDFSASVADARIDFFISFANARIDSFISCADARIVFCISFVANVRTDFCFSIANSRIGICSWTANARIDSFVSIVNARERIDFFKNSVLAKPASAEASLSTKSTPAEVNLVVTKMSGSARLTISSLVLALMVSKSLSGVPVRNISTHPNLLAAKYLQPTHVTINKSQVNRNEYCFALYSGSRFISNRGRISNLDSHHFEVMIFRDPFTKSINRRMNSTISSSSLL